LEKRIRKIRRKIKKKKELKRENYLLRVIIYEIEENGFKVISDDLCAITPEDKELLEQAWREIKKKVK